MFSGLNIVLIQCQSPESHIFTFLDFDIKSFFSNLKKISGLIFPPWNTKISIPY